MKYINLFDTQAAYDAAEKYYPNVSYIEATDEVVYQEISPEPYSGIIVAKFTTTSANQNVKITNNQARFSDISIDGVDQTIGTGALNHTFASAGKHIVEYKALDTTLIPDSAFNNCSKLTSVTIPNSVTSIGNSAFGSCYGLTSVTIPNSVTSIGTGAFYDCSGLTAITIPNSVTSIGINAFNHCYRLTSVTIPNSVTSIGINAFGSCFGLTSIVVENGNRKYDSRNNCNAIIETETNTLIAGCKNTVIPNSVTSIGQNAFSECTGLTSITIPNSVTSIGESAFQNCDGLTSVTIGNSVTTIGQSAFYRCTGLTSVTIPNSVTSIGESVFTNCSNLTSVTIGNSVTEIGYSPFQECTSLTSIVVENGNTKYDSRDNCNAIIETATNTLIAGCKNTVIPNSVTSIGQNAFSECTGLTSITIPNSVTSIGESAFQNCDGLTSVTIGNSVTTIGQSAFGFCTGLTSITSLATTPPTIQRSTFDHVPDDCPIYVPDESFFEYQDAEGWRDRGNCIQPI